MADYTVNKTDTIEVPIDVQEKRVDTSSLDVALFGKIRLEYGERLNEDLLNILENFACVEKTSVTPIVPDLDQTSNTQLSNPTIGQFWYNSTRELIFFWTGEEWTQTQVREDVAANWGQIMDGQQVPRPVSAVTGYTFPYDECIWSVAPSVLVGKIGYMVCTTDANATLTMRYRLSGTSNIVSGQANYLIIGMRNGGTNTGPFLTPPAITPTATVTPSITMTASVTPTPANSQTPTPAVTTTPTPAITNTPNPTVSATVTPTRAPSSTPAASSMPTPTPAASSMPTPTPTPSTSGASTLPCGGDPCFDNCPLTTSLLPDGRMAGDVKVGDVLLLADEVTLIDYTGVVSYSQKAIQETVKFTTKTGVVLSCSKTAPIATDNGFVDADKIFGLNVAVWHEGKRYFDEVVELVDLGEQEVQHITVENKAFWVGDNAASFVLHHNMKWCCDANDNCMSVPPHGCACYIC
jgi:hypothetical protein